MNYNSNETNAVTSSMMIYAAEWQGVETFRMIPLNPNCPFNEVMYDPINKVLAVVSKDRKVKPQLLPKINEKGDTVVKGFNKDREPQYVQQRVLMDMYYEYYIENEKDIKDFVLGMSTNPNHEVMMRVLNLS
jgi:hypothetical protein